MTTKSCGTWQAPERSALDGVQDPWSKYCEEDGFHALHVESVQFVYCRCLFAMPLLRSIFSGCHCSNADLARSDDLPVNVSSSPETWRQRRCHVRFTAQRLPETALDDVRRSHHISVLAALLKQPLYLSMLGCGFSSRVLNRAKNHVLENFVASHPTLG